MQKGRWIFIILILLFQFVGCKKEEVAQELIRPVRFMKIKKGLGRDNKVFSGIAKAQSETRMSFKVAGTIKKIHVKVGGKVKKGNALIRLDNKDYRLKLQKIKAQLKQATAKRNNSKRQYNRINALYENNNASRTDLDNARTAWTASKSQVLSIRNGVELTKQQLKYTVLRSPVEGVISTINPEVNENVAVGMHVLTITSNKKLEIKINVPENYISYIKEKMKATIRFDSIPKKIFLGEVSEVSVSTSQFATIYPVFIRLIKNSDKIRPGMSAEVNLVIDTANNRGSNIILPTHVIGEDDEGRYIFILEKKDHSNIAIAKKRYVKIGQLTDKGLEIIDGPGVGELVITAGISKIKNGQKVRLLKK